MTRPRPRRFRASGRTAAASALLALLAPAAALAADLIPAEHFFASHALTRVRLSPSGSHAAGIAPADDHQTLVVVDLADRKPVSRLVIPEPRLSPLWIPDGERRLEDFWWVNDDRLLLSVSREGGHQSHLVLVGRDGTGVVENHRRVSQAGLAPPDDDVVSLLIDDPARVLVAFPHRLHGRFVGFDVRQLGVATAQTEVVERYQTDVVRWFSDSSGAVRAGVGVRDGAGFAVYRDGPGGALTTLDDLGGVQLDPLLCRVLGVEGDALYVASRHEGDRFALYRYEVAKQKFSEALFAHPEFDVAGPLVVDWNGAPLGVRYSDDYDRIHWLDPAWQKRQRAIDAARPGVVNSIVSWSRDASRVVVRSENDRNPPVYDLWGEPDGGFQSLARHHPELDPTQLVASTPVRIRARDGLELSGYLMLPAGAAGPVPFIVEPYGGPWPRARRGFDAEAQFLASRGWGVLRLNGRGTTGLGRRYETAGYGEWGASAQDDVSDATHWLVAQGHADAQRICVYGTGYGGYAAMMAVAREPELYRCAASHGGISDLPGFLANRRGTSDADAWELRLGDKARLSEASPIHHIPDIRAPVFVSHGKQDRLVGPDQSRSFALALRDAGKAVSLYVWQHDGHDLKREASRLDYYGKLERFFATNLDPEGVARARAP